ncbi:hypothetical protein O181_036044 [Austropuccinia psidii MF-1]|uniref:Uncharacterized protein n=1 Tax=Austropuccinia psidii MF-1 TaxID=1389203 RepID=A0A9Q3HB56_9BASI|nr:hypothetical protein [Austropuccinia psidii MF-1]
MCHRVGYLPDPQPGARRNGFLYHSENGAILSTKEANAKLVIEKGQQMRFKRCAIPRLTGISDTNDVTTTVFSAYPSCGEIHITNGNSPQGHVYNAWCDMKTNPVGPDTRPLCDTCYQASFKPPVNPTCRQV